MAIVLLLFPLSLKIQQVGLHRGIYAGALVAALHTLWFWLAPPMDVTVELWLGTTMLMIGIGFAISYVEGLQQSHDKQLDELNRDLRHERLRIEAFRIAMPDRAFIYDQNGYYVDVISALIAPENRDALVGTHVTNTPHILEAETARQLLSTIQKTVETGERQHLEYQAFTSKEKEWRWLEGQTALVKAPSLTVPWVVWVARDITERKRIEEDLQTLQHLAHIGLWETDVKDNRVIWSDETYRIYGLTRDEFDHRVESVTARFHPDDLEEFQSKIENGINPYPCEYRIIRPDGSIRTVFAVGEAIYDEYNQVIRRIGMVQDITERRKAQEEHIQLQIAQQRTSTLHNLVSNLTHDLMTPVTVIKTSTYILRQLNTNERMEQHIDKVEDHIDILQKIVESLMLVSYLDDIQLDNLAPKSSDIMLLFHSLVQQYRSIMRSKNQTLIATLPDQPILIRYDHEYMQRAIGNLLQNAMEYTPDGGEIEFDVHIHGKQLVIVVRDNGIGIGEDDQNHIFDPFYRVEKHRPVNGNSGLGLRITKLIIELHGGQISVESIPGHGSTFQLELPMV